MTRVLSIPGRRHENSYFELMATALEEHGVEIVEPTAWNLACFAYDALHLNFPTHYITENRAPRAVVYSVLLGWYFLMVRLLGRKIVYTVHDVVPLRPRHEFLLWPFLRLTHWLTDGFIFLSHSSRESFVRRFPYDTGKPWLFAPHGPYPASLLTPAERLAHRRAVLGDQEAFVVGFLGSIKPYKNIHALAALPERVAGARPVHLLVAGVAECGHEAAVQTVLAARPAGTVTRLDQRLNDEEFDRLIQIVDVVVLPYERGSNSGLAMLVLSNEARLIGSDLPIFQELAQGVGPPWVYCSGGKDAVSDLAEVVHEVAAGKVAEGDRQRLRRYLQSVSYHETAGQIAALYARVCGERRLSRAHAQ